MHREYREYMFYAYTLGHISFAQLRSYLKPA